MPKVSCDFIILWGIWNFPQVDCPINFPLVWINWNPKCMETLKWPCTSFMTGNQVHLRIKSLIKATWEETLHFFIFFVIFIGALCYLYFKFLYYICSILLISKNGYVNFHTNYELLIVLSMLFLLLLLR